jgi:phytol kinase
MRDLLGLILSFSFIVAALAVSQLLYDRRVVTHEVSRKIVHVAVAHWWLIAMYFHDALHFAVIGPAVFIIVNAVSLKRGQLTAMNQGGAAAGSGYALGTVYYPVSLLLMVFFTFGGPAPEYLGAVGALIMGWGDGFAALIGRARPLRRWRLLGIEKSVSGIATMFVLSALVTGLVTLAAADPGTVSAPLLLAALSTAAVATAVEAVTPFGLDNLSVPLLSTAFYYGVFL